MATSEEPNSNFMFLHLDILHHQRMISHLEAGMIYLRGVISLIGEQVKTRLARFLQSFMAGDKGLIYHGSNSKYLLIKGSLVEKLPSYGD